MTKNISQLITEKINQKSLEIDLMESESILRLMNEEDRTVADAVALAIPQIAKAVDLIVAQMKRGGRLIYVGAGTSGRLGVLDASECPPTFGTDPSEVTFTIAGGEQAFLKAVEGAEDNWVAGQDDLRKLNLKADDVVVAISASGRTPYCIGALVYAGETGCPTIALSCNAGAEMSDYADIPIEVVVGPEILAGSTRLKAGTAQKMVLNMLSTASMIRQGKAYQNLMVDMQPTNLKLRERAIRMVVTATGVSSEEGKYALQQANWHVKAAIVMLLTRISVEDAATLLDQAGGFVRKAIDLHRETHTKG